VLSGDGTVAGWGAEHEGQSSVPASLSGVAAIAAGANHGLAVTAGNMGAMQWRPPAREGRGARLA
jgi:hypothetical protein